jgi:protein tyrosine phosphatase (PTP) superfamily phosphohydrolase (DUF442 family)
MWTFLILWALQSAAAPAASQSSDPATIRNFMRVSTDFCTGGQPRMEHFAALKAEGVRSVLNLRTPGEHSADEERQAAEAAGLKYFNVPVVYAAPTFENVSEFLRITDDVPNRPIFVHCTAAIRVGAFWLIRRVVRDAWTWDRALAEAHKVGLTNAPHLEEFAKKYIEQAANTAGPPAK